MITRIDEQLSEVLEDVVEIALKDIKIEKAGGKQFHSNRVNKICRSKNMTSSSKNMYRLPNIILIHEKRKQK